ncbi:Epidermal growth factor receptor kinase substrate 8-like [Halocaridina rubra]|uniref:Epidermal growth factor receptor kinase substrate 8-like n=1 Tax=Halocaridina rubra TaxID=373956 RepID=A0AAN8WJ02_HALRR
MTVYTFNDSSDEEEPPVIRKKPVVRSSSIPEPPPPPPSEITPESNTDLMNAELKMVLESFRRARPHLDIVKTPAVYINQQSTPEEVQNWLKLKGFSKRICKQFDGVDGERLFALEKKQLLDFCGQLEGARLDSQITIQRNISGYKTARSTELRQILAKRRDKVDTDKDSAKLLKISEQFGFLQDYDSKSGYQTDSESEGEAGAAKESEGAAGAAGGNAGTNTLKEQIKKQRKKMYDQSNDDKASR